MSIVITSYAAPVRLFGCIVPGIRAVASGDVPLALVKPMGGGKFKTIDGKLSPKDRAKVSAGLKRL